MVDIHEARDEGARRLDESGRFNTHTSVVSLNAATWCDYGDRRSLI